MHERGLVSQVALKLASITGEAEVGAVTLALNPETEPAVVHDAWRSVTAGTPIEGAVLECVTRSHTLQCLDCGAQYPGGKLDVCPECAGNGLIVEPSSEVALAGWSVREPV